jgi:hypothetical protein
MVASNSTVTEGSRILQERLHILLSRLSSTIDHVKNWPEASGDDASIHVESTSKLIDCIRQVIASLEKVEDVVKTDSILKKSLNECSIPLDLLDLLDSSLNPECFSRGLLREALGQLAGLKRRKLALEMLGAAVQAGLNKRAERARISEQDSVTDSASKKRSRSEEEEEETDEQEEPPTKRPNNAATPPASS